MFDATFMRLALAASIATGASLGLMGVYLAIRRVVFLGLVLANAATLGAAVAQAVGLPPEVPSMVIAVATAVLLGGIETPNRVSAESLMGWAYAAASSATVLILAWAATGDADMLHLLFGNILAVQVSHAVGLVAVALGVGLVHALFKGRFLLVTFAPEAAKVANVNVPMWSLALNATIGIAAAAAVHEIGALLTFALLTLPTMAALLTTTSLQATFTLAASLGVILPCLGLAASFYFDLPAGPTSVALLALSVSVAALLPGRGQLDRAGTRRQLG